MIPGAILAGGRAQRMGGGDKGLLALGPDSMLALTVARLRPQTSTLLLNTNSPPALFAPLGLEIRADARPGRLGPLAGILTAMLWASALGADIVLTVPGDSPFLPANLVTRLAEARGTGAAIAASGGHAHPVTGLWPCALAAQLDAALASGTRRVREFLALIPHTQVEFPDESAFWNINTPEDLARARAMLAAQP